MRTAAHIAGKVKLRRVLPLKIFLVCCLLGLLCAESSALDRKAFTFTRYDLHARVTPAQQGFAVQGRVTLRNDSAFPQRALALQISSTLLWRAIQLNGKPVAYTTGTYTSDADHTGQLSEAIVTLASDVSPQSTVELEVAYDGTIPANAARLTRIGVPAETAMRSDWDRITTDFTGVRGVGYVCWYPVAMEALNLSESPAMFATLGEWKERHAASEMHLALSVVSDDMAVTNGRLLGQKARAEAEGTVHERDYEFSPLGATPPTFVIAPYTVLSRPAVNVYHLPGRPAAAQEYVLAAEKLLPFITGWFGAQHEKVAIVELPPGDAPFDSGALLFTPLSTPNRNSVEVAVAHTLAHACFRSARPWITEGAAGFAQALVRERQDGRKGALAYMQTFRPALAQAEQASAAAAASPDNKGQPLIRATDEVYFRVKAMFVWWMLRDMVGDTPLQRALQSYRAADDKQPGYVQRLLETHFKKPLEWFFDDWVYRDRGLPDFHIESAYARQLLPENYTVTVTVENLGATAAEIPVLIPLERGEAQQRVLVTGHGKAVARITSPVEPAAVVVNDGSVPESNISNNTSKPGATER